MWFELVKEKKRKLYDSIKFACLINNEQTQFRNFNKAAVPSINKEMN